MPDKLEIIGNGALRGCMAVKELVIPDSVRIIGSNALTYMIFSTIKLPSSLTLLGEGNLQNCTYLKEIRIQGNQLYTINRGALCYKNAIVRFPPSKDSSRYETAENITHILKGAFRDCVYLKEFYGANIQIIDDYAFADSPNLELVELPNIKRLSSKVFFNCKNLRQIDISKSDIIEISYDSLADVNAEIIVNHTQFENFQSSKICKKYLKLLKTTL